MSKRLNYSGASMRGFTLVELLVAMVIFSIMAGGMYLVFNNFIRVKEVTDRDSARLAAMQRAFTFIQRDISFVVPRPVRDEYGSVDRSDAMISNGDEIEFTRGGWNSPPFLERKRSELQRVGYKLEEGKLIREYWYVLDRAQDSTSRKLELLEGVEELSFLFYFKNSTGNSVEETVWPPTTSITLSNVGGCGIDASGNDIRLPDVVQMTVKLVDYGEIVRKYSVLSHYAAMLDVEGC